MKIINILCGSDNNYIFGYASMLKSLYINNKDNDYLFNVHYLYCSLSEESKKYLVDNCKNEKMDFAFYKIEDELISSFPTAKHLTKEAYLRLVCHYVLPADVDRILWIDGDIIINGDISEYYFQDLENYMYVGVRNKLENNEKHKDDLGIPKDEKYINTGFCLINLDEVRKKIDIQQLKNYAEKYLDYIIFCDQDIINGLYYKHIKVISDLKWNGIGINYNKKTKAKDYIVIHYASGMKPWKANYNLYLFDVFWGYAKELSDGKVKYSTAKKTYNKEMLKKRIYPVKMRIKSITPKFIWYGLKGIIR